MEEWYRAYRLDMQREYASILRLGRRLQALANMPVVPRIFTACARMFPQLGDVVVKSTRMGPQTAPENGDDGYG